MDRFGRKTYTLRLSPENHKAISRFSVETGYSINEIINKMVEKSVPQKYFGDPYKEPSQKSQQDIYKQVKL